MEPDGIGIELDGIGMEPEPVGAVAPCAPLSAFFFTTHALPSRSSVYFMLMPLAASPPLGLNITTASASLSRNVTCVTAISIELTDRFLF